MTAGSGPHLAERRASEAARETDFLVYVVGRPLMLALWALVLWGTLVDAAALFLLATRGTRAVIESLFPRGGSPLAVLNTVLGVLAAIVWLAVAALSRRSCRPTNGGEEGENPPAD